MLSQSVQAWLVQLWGLSLVVAAALAAPAPAVDLLSAVAPVAAGPVAALVD